jgi:uridine kinase
LTKLQKWLLRRIARRVVIQGSHKRRIIEFYSILIEAAREEFVEDNKPTLDGFLEECHSEALNGRNNL